MEGNHRLGAESEARKVENVRVLDAIKLVDLLFKVFGTVHGHWLAYISASVAEELYAEFVPIEHLVDLLNQLFLLLLRGEDDLFDTGFDQVLSDGGLLLDLAVALLLSLEHLVHGQALSPLA